MTKCYADNVPGRTDNYGITADLQTMTLRIKSKHSFMLELAVYDSESNKIHWYPTFTTTFLAAGQSCDYGKALQELEMSRN